MLVLSRKLGESIFIGNDIEVVLIDANDHRQSARLFVESGGACLKTTLGMNGDGYARFIWLSEVVKLTLLEVNGRGKVRLGIDAPKEVRIWRGEIRPLKDNVVDKNGGSLNGVGRTGPAPTDRNHQPAVETRKPERIDSDLQKGRHNARDQEAADDHTIPDPDLQV